MKYRQVFSARKLARIAVLLALPLPITASWAGHFTSSAQLSSTQDWNDAIWAPGPVRSAAGNSYELLFGGIIQPPTAGTIHKFWGDSLMLDAHSTLDVVGQAGEVLNFPGVNAQPGLILNGGRLHTQSQTANQVITIAGFVSVTAPSYIGNVSGLGGIVVTAQLVGTGGLTLTTVSLSHPLDIQSADNSYSGSWSVGTGYLKGSGAGSLGTGNITVSPGAAFEVSYDIQTPGVLTLLGNNSVMVLHQDCRFSVVTINGVTLAPGTYPYNNLLAQFPGNFATGGSGSITVPLPPRVFVSPPPPLLPGYYVDYAGGSDSNVGTNAASAWQHCPGDSAATGRAGSTPLHPGDTVFFKGGVTYILTGSGNPLYSQVYRAGIALNWSGTAGNPITYCATAAWGTGRAVFTDGYGANSIVAFGCSGSANNLVFNNLEIGPIGGSATLPPDTGSAVPAKPGAGILAGGSLDNVTVANCYFHHLGYSFNQQPMGGNSIQGVGVQCADFVGLTITNCEFARMERGCELQIVNSSSNLKIANCNFHDAIVWCIDLPHDYDGISLDSVSICGNTFSNFCQQWSNWSGYGGWPHADGIFDRGDNLATFNDGPNINVYGNTFVDTQPGGSTGEITMEGGVSMNIYNNLFNNPVSTPINPWNDGQAPGGITHTNFLVRIYNNTFYVGSVVGGDIYASGYPNYVWRTGASTQLDVKNNVFYDSLSGNYLVDFNITNTAAAYAKIAFDYNCYRSTSSDGNFIWQKTNDAYPGGYGTNLNGLRGYGWEMHGMAADPLFASVTGVKNFHLQPDSPCLGTGVNLSGLNLPGLNADKDGNPRPASGPWDIGAYQ